MLMVGIQRQRKIISDLRVDAKTSAIGSMQMNNVKRCVQNLPLQKRLQNCRRPLQCRQSCCSALSEDGGNPSGVSRWYGKVICQHQNSFKGDEAMRAKYKIMALKCRLSRDETKRACAMYYIPHEMETNKKKKCLKVIIIHTESHQKDVDMLPQTRRKWWWERKPLNL